MESDERPLPQEHRQNVFLAILFWKMESSQRESRKVRYFQSFSEFFRLIQSFSEFMNEGKTEKNFEGSWIPSKL